MKQKKKKKKSKVRLGNGKPIQVEGKGTVALKTECGNAKLIHDVQYAPCLAHNLFKCRTIDIMWLFCCV